MIKVNALLFWLMFAALIVLGMDKVLNNYGGEGGVTIPFIRTAEEKAKHEECAKAVVLEYSTLNPFLAEKAVANTYYEFHRTQQTRQLINSRCSAYD